MYTYNDCLFIIVSVINLYSKTIGLLVLTYLNV